MKKEGKNTGKGGKRKRKVGVRRKEKGWKKNKGLKEETIEATQKKMRIAKMIMQTSMQLL